MLNSVAEPQPTLPPFNNPYTREAMTTAPIPAHLRDRDLEKLQPPDADINRFSRTPSFFGRFSTPLPPKRHRRIVRHARHTFLTVYRRLFSLVFISNVIALWVVVAKYRSYSQQGWLAALANAASANLMVALLIRQDYIVNILFRYVVCKNGLTLDSPPCHISLLDKVPSFIHLLTLALPRLTWIVPLTAPLRLRRILAKVYELGGVHSGAAVSSIIWFAMFTGFLTKETTDFSTLQWVVMQPAIIALTYVVLLILMLLAMTAYPTCRFMAHNTFENVHRWGGWFSLALFWAELVLFARMEASGEGKTLLLDMLKLPAASFLLVSSFHAILPWLRLHKLYVVPEKLSDHAIRLHFSDPIPLFVGLRLSTAPLKEWHSFAAIPARNGKGGSVLISNAGDWTNECINNPREYYWVKGVPVTGVLCMARIFRKIVVVTTGSGIGPVLAVIQDTAQCGITCRVIWSAANPLETFGEGVIDSVKAVDPDAVIINTRRPGFRRPDLVQIAYDIYKKDGAEAVFCISNPKLTKKVVYGLEGRGVPAFGPVWDS